VYILKNNGVYYTMDPAANHVPLKCNNCNNCDYCEFKLFKQFMQLKNCHNGDKPSVVHDEVDSIPQEINPSTSLPNQCEKCNKVFTRKNILKAHITKCKGIRYVGMRVLQ
jgi:hypothetical protein